MKLTSELVPSTCFYTNLRSNLKVSEWDKVRKYSYVLANNKCEICSETGKDQGYKHNVECHEIWDYIIIDNKRIQKLVGVISLCPLCHKVKHPGLANIKGEIGLVYKQLKKVNNISQREAEDYLDEVFKIWKERSQFKWELDITWLDESKILK